MKWGISMKRAHGQMSESLLLGAMLAMAGGFDAYTYLCRGKVFANAQTGNIVLFGANIAEGNWLRAAEYFLPILAFAPGRCGGGDCQAGGTKRQSDINIHWRQIVVLVEIVLLITAAFLPQSMNTTVNIMISFICAMQVESFRKVRGSAFAKPRCTGNLRSGTEQLVIWAQTGDRNAIRKTRNYYSIILFLSSAVRIGALTTAKIGEKRCC